MRDAASVIWSRIVAVWGISLIPLCGTWIQPLVIITLVGSARLQGMNKKESSETQTKQGTCLYISILSSTKKQAEGKSQSTGEKTGNIAL